MQPSQYIELNEVATCCDLSLEELSELLEYDIIPLSGSDAGNLCVPNHWLDTLQKAAQIRRDYALDLFTMGILVNYLQRIADLENANSKLRTEVALCSR
jgi:chaperone modulatory protein CbpM